MFIDGSLYDSSQVLKTNICIIGAGAAGISIALKLANSHHNVILLESGGLKHDAYGEKLNKGFIAPGSSHEPLEKYRRRTIGGTTSAWGGRCLPFDPIDFKNRDYVNDSGWPIDKETLSLYYSEATKICEAGNNSYLSTESFPDKQKEIFPGFDSEHISSQALEKWSPPTHFGKKYGHTLKEAPNIQVIYNLSCTHIQLNDNGTDVVSVKVSGKNKLFHIIEADQFILAGGCIENTRLMLASNDIHQAGIGNHFDVLGRYYMAHLWGVTTKVKLNHQTLPSYIHDFEKDSEGIYVRRRFAMTEQGQRELGILNVIGFFFRPEVHDPSHKDPIMSIIHLMKSGSMSITGGTKWDENTRKHVANVVMGLPKAVNQIRQINRQRKEKRRLPYVITPKNAREQHFYYQAEQAPNPTSRISLSPNERDASGLARAIVNLQFSDIDLKTVKVFHQKMGERFAKSKLGEFHYDEQAITANYETMVNDFDSGSHHIGSTRMSDSPQKGVVDANCKVHGVDNLYISGASIFPTSSHANPTLTIVALALRLADQLKEKKKEQSRHSAHSS